MTRHGRRDSSVRAPTLWTTEPLVVHTAHGADDVQMIPSPGLGGDAWQRNARPALSSTRHRTARKPAKPQAEIIKSP